MKKTYTTSEAATKIGVGFRTLNRWLSSGIIRPTGIPYGGNKFLWVWTKADLDRAKEIKATLKPGRKPRKAKP
jgi:predicted site-specific integrase-resolvase